MSVNDLFDLDSTLKLEQVKIFWFKEVQQVTESNKVKAAYFLLATHGVFLYKKKSISNRLRISIAIPFSKLVSITLSGDVASFSSSQKQIRVKDEEITTFATLAYFIRQAQFSSDLLPLTVHFPDKLLQSLPESAPYSDFVFGDRLITCAYDSGITLNQNELSEIFQQFSFENGTIIISPSQVNCSFLPAIIKALAYEQTLETLHCINIKLSTFIKNAGALFKYSQFIRTLIFEDCDFTDTAEEMYQHVTMKHSFRPDTIIFMNCNAEKSDFERFFDSLTNICTKYKHFEFVNTIISKIGIQTIFQSMLFSESCHSLQTLKFVKIPNLFDLPNQIIDLINTEWAISSQCLKEIEISGGGLDSSSFILNLSEISTQLDILRLRGSDAQLLISLKRPRLGPFKILDFSGSIFSSQNFIQIFMCNERESLVYKGIDLSDVTISPPLYNDIFNFLIENRYNMINLTTLFFDNNRLKGDEIIIFSKFLKRLPNLQKLSANNTIDAGSYSIAAKEFIDTLSQMKLTFLSIRSSEMRYSFGSLMRKLLISLISKKHIKFLDITGQRMDKFSFGKLVELVNKMCLEELYFDYLHPGSLSDLLKFCNLVLKSSITYSVFPECSVEFYVSSSTTEEELEEIQSIREHFFYSYGIADFSNKRRTKKIAAEEDAKVEAKECGITCASKAELLALFCDDNGKSLSAVENGEFLAECCEIDSSMDSPIIDYVVMLAATVSTEALIKSLEEPFSS